MSETPTGDARAARRRDTIIVIALLVWSGLVMAGFLANSAGHLLDKLKEFHVL